MEHTELLLELVTHTELQNDLYQLWDAARNTEERFVHNDYDAFQGSFDPSRPYWYGGHVQDGKLKHSTAVFQVVSPVNTYIVSLLPDWRDDG